MGDQTEAHDRSDFSLNRREIRSTDQEEIRFTPRRDVDRISPLQVHETGNDRINVNGQSTANFGWFWGQLVFQCQPSPLSWYHRLFFTTATTCVVSPGTKSTSDASHFCFKHRSNVWNRAEELVRRNRDFCPLWASECWQHHSTRNQEAIGSNSRYGISKEILQWVPGRHWVPQDSCSVGSSMATWGTFRTTPSESCECRICFFWARSFCQTAVSFAEDRPGPNQNRGRLLLHPFDLWRSDGQASISFGYRCQLPNSLQSGSHFWTALRERHVAAFLWDPRSAAKRLNASSPSFVRPGIFSHGFQPSYKGYQPHLLGYPYHHTHPFPAAPLPLVNQFEAIGFFQIP